MNKHASAAFTGGCWPRETVNSAARPLPGPATLPMLPAPGRRGSSFVRRLRAHPLFSALVVTGWSLAMWSRYRAGNLGVNYLSAASMGCVILWFLGTWILDKVREANTAWYFQKWFVALASLIMAPFGLTLLWIGSRFGKVAKTLITVAGCAVFILVACLSYRVADVTQQDVIYWILMRNTGQTHLPTASVGQRAEWCRGIGSQGGQSAGFTVPEVVEWGCRSVVLIKALDGRGRGMRQGSGVLLSESGVIVTNYHVVESAFDLEVEFHDGRSCREAVQVATEPQHDIALIRVPCGLDDAQPARIGDSDELELGELIVAIGNPLGWRHSVTSGLVSGIRDVKDIRLIQTDAALSPGSSGGALFNAKGELVGITTLVSGGGFGCSPPPQNVNFAVPINRVVSLIESGI